MSFSGREPARRAHPTLPGGPPIATAPADANPPTASPADGALGHPEFLAVPSASGVLAQAVLPRLAAALAPQEPKGEAFRREVLKADPGEA